MSWSIQIIWILRAFMEGVRFPCLQQETLGVMWGESWWKFDWIRWRIFTTTSGLWDYEDRDESRDSYKIYDCSLLWMFFLSPDILHWLVFAVFVPWLFDFFPIYLNANSVVTAFFHYENFVNGNICFIQRKKLWW